MIHRLWTSVWLSIGNGLVNHAYCERISNSALLNDIRIRNHFWNSPDQMRTCRTRRLGKYWAIWQIKFADSQSKISLDGPIGQTVCARLKSCCVKSFHWRQCNDCVHPTHRTWTNHTLWQYYCQTSRSNRRPGDLPDDVRRISLGVHTIASIDASASHSVIQNLYSVHDGHTHTVCTVYYTVYSHHNWIVEFNST